MCVLSQECQFSQQARCFRSPPSLLSLSFRILTFVDSGTDDNASVTSRGSLSAMVDRPRQRLQQAWLQLDSPLDYMESACDGEGVDDRDRAVKVTFWTNPTPTQHTRSRSSLTSVLSFNLTTTLRWTTRVSV